MARRIMTVDVTDEDIAAGRRDDCQHCPIARAATRAAGFPVYVYKTIYRRPGSGVSFTLPSAALAFIRRFDAGEPVEPFSFELEVPR